MVYKFTRLSNINILDVIFPVNFNQSLFYESWGLYLCLLTNRALKKNSVPAYSRHNVLPTKGLNNWINGYSAGNSFPILIPRSIIQFQKKKRFKKYLLSTMHYRNSCKYGEKTFLQSLFSKLRKPNVTHFHSELYIPTTADPPGSDYHAWSPICGIFQSVNSQFGVLGTVFSLVVLKSMVQSRL